MGYPLLNNLITVNRKRSWVNESKKKNNRSCFYGNGGQRKLFFMVEASLCCGTLPEQKKTGLPKNI
jgi:hypothetical protein